MPALVAGALLIAIEQARGADASAAGLTDMRASSPLEAVQAGLPPSLVQRAMAGDPEAQFRLGGMHARGEGMDQDHEAAVLWWRMAAGQGFAEAQNELGTAYAEGRGVDEDLTQAMQWFEQAADQGLAIAQSNLAILYWSGRGVGNNDRRAVELFRQSADKGLGWAQFYLGEAYEEGRGIRRNFGRAAHWYRRAAEQGYSDAQFRLGKLYRIFPEQIPVIDSRVLEAYGEHWIALAARAGQLEAQAHLERWVRTNCRLKEQAIAGSVHTQPDETAPVLRVTDGRATACVLPRPGRTARTLAGWEAILLLDHWVVGFVRNEDLSAR